VNRFTNVGQGYSPARYRLPLKILLLDNSQLGMVRQWQEVFFNEQFSEIDLTDNPDFAEVARSFGIEAFTIDYRSEVSAAIDRLLATEDRSCATPGSTRARMSGRWCRPASPTSK
jgi:acetolactate synthase-1/2/3 large subunit